MPMKLLNLEPQRRNAILNAALKEFASKGFDNASTNIIAKESGISKALMFHYAENKQALFLCVYDFFADLLDKEYFTRMNFTEKDIFERLRQSYLLQIELLKQYPWIFEFHKLSVATYPDEINRELEKRACQKQVSCCSNLFDGMDESKFKAGLNIEMCKQVILWANIGLTNQILEEINRSQYDITLYDICFQRLDAYFGELKKIFYASDEVRHV